MKQLSFYNQKDNLTNKFNAHVRTMHNVKCKRLVNYYGSSKNVSLIHYRTSGTFFKKRLLQVTKGIQLNNKETSSVMSCSKLTPKQGSTVN